MKDFEIIIKTLFGFEEILSAELEEIGAEHIEILNRAVKCRGNTEMLYKCNYLLRTAVKVLKPIAYFNVSDEKDLYTKIFQIDWDNFMSRKNTFAIDAVTNSEIFKHSKYVALKVKDAIVDQYRDNYGMRPSVDIENPDIRINVHISEDKCTLSLDSSGIPLNKRGYKISQTFAPLSEVLAAGIIILSGWDKKKSFIDPMCGSGSFSIEAALIAKNIPPGYFRSFCFEKWKNFDNDLWSDIKNEAKLQICDYEGRIISSDISKKSIDAINDNAERAGVKDIIEIKESDFFTNSEVFENSFLVINPPYGERLDKDADMTDFYKQIGTQLKHFYPGSEAWVLSGNLDAIKFVGLKPSKKIKLFNGPIECRLHKFELFSGRRKDYLV